MKLIKFLVLSAAIIMATVGASQGAPASITPATSKPGATFPTNGSLVTSYASGITFTWTASAGTGGKYDIDIATDAAFTTSNIIDGTFGLPKNGNSFHSLYSYSPAMNYYWRVQAYASGVASGWAVFSFRTSVARPTLLTPANGSTLDNNRTNDIVDDTTNNPVMPLFSWSSITGASGYTLEVSQSSQFNSFVITVNLPYTATSYTPTADLPANMVLFWRVETLNSTFGPSTWAYWSFTTGNPPSIPNSLQPTSGNVDNDFTPGLFWHAVTIPGGTTFVDYDVQMSINKKFNSPNDLCFDDEINSITQGNPTLDVQTALASDPIGASCPTFIYQGDTSLQPATTYYWRVRAVDIDGFAHNSWSDWSSVNTLYTSYPKVDYTTFTPADGSTLTSNSQHFSWIPPVIGTGAIPTVFNIQIFSTPDFRKGGVVNITKNGAMYIPQPPLPTCTTLYWRVSAGSSNSLYGISQWSKSATIFTACPPSVPGPYSPKQGAVVPTAKPTLNWKISTVPFAYPFTYYEIEITPDKTFQFIMDDDTSVTNQLTSSFTLTPALTIHTTYYWRMRGCDSQPACSYWSTVFSFKY